MSAPDKKIPQIIPEEAEIIKQAFERYALGIYTDAGRKTCEGRPGSYGYEAIDARTYASY